MYKENKRYIARFVVETNTPLAIGSGEQGLTVDRLIIRDANGLPYIPGTSLAGVIRHEIEENTNKKVQFYQLFGFSENDIRNDETLSADDRKLLKEENGSRISFSSAMLLADDGKTVLEGLNNIDFSIDYYSFFHRLPERDHVRISHRAAADTEGHGKFDEQLVHKGVRFVFEIEIEGTESDSEMWNEILNILQHPAFRVGAGTRNGFGQLKIIECKTKEIDLGSDMVEYLAISSNLNKDLTDWKEFIVEESKNANFFHYQVKLIPENFYMFGAGIGDKDVDMSPKTEKYFEWNNGVPELSEDKILIPATSVKGALSHRVAYWYNKLKGITVDVNAAEYDSIDAKKLLNSLVDLNFFRDELVNLNNLLNEKIDENADIQELKSIKEKLKVKKQELYKVQAKFQELKTEEIIEKSKLWEEYSKDLEGQLKQFEALKPNVAEMNNAVRELFGFAKDSSKSDGLRGRTIFSDIYLDKTSNNVIEKIFDHVAIDRFTGGGISGALYQEKAILSEGFVLDIFVELPAFNDNEIKIAFERTLDDLVKGQIQLGGNTGKGHGAFIGEYKLVNA